MFAFLSANRHTSVPHGTLAPWVGTSSKSSYSYGPCPSSTQLQRQLAGCHASQQPPSRPETTLVFSLAMLPVTNRS